MLVAKHFQVPANQVAEALANAAQDKVQGHAVHFKIKGARNESFAVRKADDDSYHEDGNITVDWNQDRVQSSELAHAQVAKSDHYGHETHQDEIIPLRGLFD